MNNAADFGYQPSDQQLTWFGQGYQDAKNGLPSDPPGYRGHGAYENYRADYQYAENETV